MTHRIILSLLISITIVTTGCSQHTSVQTAVTEADISSATTLYINADIVTVDESKPVAEALAVRDGQIIAVGSREEVEFAAGEQPTIRDLGGKTIVPGLIDAHGHISVTALSRGWANTQPPPAGPVNNIAELQKIMINWDQNNPDIPWLIGWGYDDSLLEEARHPNRDDLDAISTEKPVVLFHVSGHLMACNSKCLEMVGISAETENPAGGIIQRFGDSKIPNGILEESALNIIFSKLPVASESQRMQKLQQTQQYYASYGITTVQDGASNPGHIHDLQKIAGDKKLYLDVVAYKLLLKGDSIGEKFTVTNEYQDHFRIGGVKLLLDGSPQGKTAWLTKPYFHPPHDQGEDYKGYPRFDDAEVSSFIKESFIRKIPVLVHANGDAAADQLINAVSVANKELGIANRRTVMIHAQTAREDQIVQMQAQGIIPSYFVAHTFYWGDWHRDSVFGKQRASRISPLQSTVNQKIPFTTHNDTPVVPPDMMRLLWSSVNRITRTGKVLGKEQRIAPLEALKSMTLYAAYQFSEENKKGSIVPGKLADLTILSENPLKVEAISIKDIIIEETIKEGVTVYRRGGE